LNQLLAENTNAQNTWEDNFEAAIRQAHADNDAEAESANRRWRDEYEARLADAIDAATQMDSDTIYEVCTKIDQIGGDIPVNVHAVDFSNE